MKLFKSLAAATALLLVVGSTAQAQRPERPFVIEARGGIYVPTFDITDLADAGPGAGATFGYMVTPKIMVFGEADFGFHSASDDFAAVVGDIDINVYHYMAKAGYVVYEGPDQKLKVLLNAGVGAMTFDPDVDGAETNTYFAINAGAKLYYLFAQNVGFVLSPQGDIAFTSEDDGFTGSTAWVWPFTAGFFVNF